MTVTPRQLAAAAAVVVVVLVSMATRAPASGALPGPPVISSAAAAVRAAQAAKPKIYTPSGPLKVGGCVISVSDPNPKIAAASETITVRTTAGAWVSLSASYASYTSNYGTQAAQDGNAVFELVNPNATPGRTVTLAARATLQASQADCNGSFTPESRACSVTALGEALAAGRSVETVAISTAPGSQVRVEKSSESGFWNYSKSAPSGEVRIAIPVSAAEVGRSVRVQVQVAMLGAQAGCVTSFVPVFHG